MLNKQGVNYEAINYFACTRGRINLVFSSSHAALTAVDLDGNFTNGHEGVYDDVLDVTWMADTNIASTFSFNTAGVRSDGYMQATTANEWIDNVNTGNLFGVSTWRMPLMSPVNGANFVFDYSYDGSTDAGFNIGAPVDSTFNPYGKSPNFVGNEIAYHYYVNLDGVSRCHGQGTDVGTRVCHTDSSQYGLDDVNNEENKSLFKNLGFNYWFAPQFINGSDYKFFLLEGSIGRTAYTISNSNYMSVWLVADGNVAASAVPIPAAAWLFGSGLIGLLGIRKLNKDV